MAHSIALPTASEADLAGRAIRALAQVLEHGSADTVSLTADGQGAERATIPRHAFELLLEVLGQMANGNAVTLVPVHAELTTQQAADLLNVSRPYLIKLLDEQKLPYHKVGTHRRIRAEALFSYRQTQAEAASRALDELSEMGRDFDMV